MLFGFETSEDIRVKTKSSLLSNNKRSRANSDVEPGYLEYDKIEKYQKAGSHGEKENFPGGGNEIKKIRTFSFNLQDQFNHQNQSYHKNKSYHKANKLGYSNELQKFPNIENILSIEDLMKNLKLPSNNTFSKHLDRMKIAGLSQEKVIENHLNDIINRKSLSNRASPNYPKYSPLCQPSRSNCINPELIQINGLVSGNFAFYSYFNLIL